MLKNIHSTVTTAAFACVIGIPGAIGLATTELPDTNISVLKGAYQRIYEDRFSDGFVFSTFSREALNALNISLFGQVSPDVVIGADEWLFTGEEFKTPATPSDLAQELRAARDNLDKQGIMLVPVIIPDKARVYRDKLPRDRGEALTARYQKAQNILDAMDFPRIDLLEMLQEGRKQQITFMRTDTHWSPFGARLAADQLASVLRLTSSETDAFITEEKPDQMFHGDLMKFVDTGRFSEWAGISKEHITLPVTRAGKGGGLGLLGDAEVGIVLVGTSFSARTEFNFDGALKTATQMDVVNLSVEGQGPFKPMKEALESAAIADIAPQFVIWEIPERYIQPWRSE